MENGYTFNSLEFIKEGGPVSMLVGLILLAMSVASWYLIVSKSLQAMRMREAFKAYVEKFWSAPNLAAAVRTDGKVAVQNPEIALHSLAVQAIAAAEHYQSHASKNADRITQDEFVARTMNRCIAEESARLEKGLTVLASVGSVSPFVGLFGTVWGIYHALASISLSGQATLDKVAGPVGEALIMTALGLAVAIPAVLGYNALVRSNRVRLAEMEKFGYELHTLLTTGAVLQRAQTVKTATGAKEHMHAVEVAS